MNMVNYDDMKRTLAKLLAYTTIEQPGRKEITWNTWWTADGAYRGKRSHAFSMASPHSRFNRALTSIAEFADMFLDDGEQQQ